MAELFSAKNKEGVVLRNVENKEQGEDEDEGLKPPHCEIFQLITFVKNPRKGPWFHFASLKNPP